MKRTTRLEDFRTSRGMTQGQLAERFGMDARSGQVSISRMEKGRQNTPGVIDTLMDEIEENDRLRDENRKLKDAIEIIGSRKS